MIDSVREAALAVSGQAGKVDRFPHYPMVPKGYYANLRYRKSVCEAARDEPDVARGIWLMCRQDLLFYVNTFCWVFEPRISRTPNLPFITWKYQDEAFAEIQDAIGNHDLLFEKTRDMSASWMCLTSFEHRWHFFPDQTFLMVSRNEDYVDKPGNMKSLFWKIDHLHKMQPVWLLPTGRWLGDKDPGRKKLHLRNADNGSTIDGESTTGDVARGDRRTAVLIDELSAFEVSDGYKALKSTRDVTRSRMFNFTPQGMGNAAFDLTQTDIRKLRLHWTVHPLKRPGLYKSRAGELEIMDEIYRYPENYPFKLDGKTRSPWYDEECKRCVHESEVRQELDIDYTASDYPFFDLDELQSEHITKQVMEPFLRGDLDYESDTAKPSDFLEREKGPLKLWINLDPKGRPPNDRDYVIGADVATGSADDTGRGASNSTLEVGDRRTREKVAEYAISGMDPYTFAKVAVALSRWFRGPMGESYLIWEANGPGRLFGDGVMRLGFRNVYYRRNELAISKKMTDVPGWWTTRDSKRQLLGEYRRGMATGEYTERSAEAVRECALYIFTAAGDIVHSRSVVTNDPTGARENHADRVIGSALMWWELREAREPEHKEPEIPADCFMARRRSRQAEESKVDLW